MKQSTKELWWQTGIVYEIYLRSFQDSNADGVGDLKGVLQRLDYLQWLGVNALWITPFYPSPMKDFGYDISDYCGIHPLFGKMDDFDELLQAVHQRNMKLIIDLVPNHTSHEHPWFKASRSSKDNAKRNWYIWKDASSGGKEPNNWQSVLGGKAWEWDDKTGQYYYHTFLKEQPELNLRNPEVQEAILDVMRFWLDKGVDGFRVDVMWYMIKDEKFRDNPKNPDYKPDEPGSEELVQAYSADQPEVHRVVRRFRELTDGYPEKVMIGELYLSIDKVVDYYGANGNGAHLPGNHQLLLLPWEKAQIALAIDKYEAALPDRAWPNWVIGNHDQPRISSRIGEAQAKVAAMLLLTLRGTPILYYGDEIGMQDVEIPKDEIQDPQGLLVPGKKSRDPQRTPMQWNDEQNAGFTKGEPWLRMHEKSSEQNVAKLKEEPYSLLLFYRQLISLRQKEPALYKGDYYPVITQGEVLAYMRKAEGSQAYLVVLNLSDKAAAFSPADKSLKGKIVFATSARERGGEFTAGSKLEAEEGILLEI